MISGAVLHSLVLQLILTAVTYGSFAGLAAVLRYGWPATLSRKISFVLLLPGSALAAINIVIFVTGGGNGPLLTFASRLGSGLSRLLVAAVGVLFALAFCAALKWQPETSAMRAIRAVALTLLAPVAGIAFAELVTVSWQWAIEAS